MLPFENSSANFTHSINENNEIEEDCVASVFLVMTGLHLLRIAMIELLHKLDIFRKAIRIIQNLYLEFGSDNLNFWSI